MNKSTFERLYPEQGLISYDELLHLYRYEMVMKYLGEYPKGTSLLDCASGNGYGAKILGDYFKYIGVDISPEAISYAKTNFGTFGTFHHYDGINLPFQDAEFDIISSLETIEHLPKEKHITFLNELLRVLKPGGKIVITTPNKNYLFKKYLISRGWSNPFHKYEYDSNEFQTFIQNNSTISIISLFVVGFPIPFPIRKLKLNLLPYNAVRFLAYKWITLGKYIPKYSNSIIVIGTKF